mgnify:FL=1|jgi:hypothetical protein
MTTLQLRNDITCTKVTNEIKMIEGITENLDYLRYLVTKDDDTEIGIAQNIFIFLSNQRSDIDRQDRREAIERRNLLNNGYTKGSH